MKVMVRLQGCDDSTVVEMSLDAKGYATIEHLKELVNAKSWCSCMPTMHTTVLEDK